MDLNKSGEIRECKRCGKMFLFTGVGKCICAACKAEDEAEFEIVKDYIYENLSATIMQVSKETGVKIARIKSYLKDGRLVIPDGSVIFLNCEICGTNIKFGRLCRECADSLSNEMRHEMNIDDFQIGEKPKNPNQGRMRFLDRT
ncbi:MerR family transcriptional regulator [Anaerocolumna sedimenticola]|uniref:MerR family transcriptional regulator n=1 Tax=Anaerocolumna sedimenticola TaxID=2696063 RepID=A0A6P1TRH9_9FIRM|nr:MerR family transcriptional regulator [Anaerocolumna sedimenticola]QHQ63544.1 MerR family transcriptional regulator [Anaerocolumna sedimenticola]